MEQTSNVSTTVAACNWVQICVHNFMSGIFQWDEEKRARNIAEHGVDFRVAAQIFQNPIVEAEDLRENYGEKRFRAVGYFGQDYYIVVYTWRSCQRRVISAWKVNDHGKRRYQELLGRRSRLDE